MTTTIIYWDAQDANNPGWAWRSRLADGSEDSGSIDDSDACDYLRAVENGWSGSVTGRDALVHTLRAEGIDPWTVRYVDTNGQDVGEMLLH